MDRTIHLNKTKAKPFTALYHLVLATFLIAVTTTLPPLPAVAGVTEAKSAVQDMAPSYLNQLTRTFYWAKPVVTFRFTRPEQATDLSQTRLPAIALSDEQKDAARTGLAKWQAALADNPEGARRRFVEVGPEEAADIEFIVMPKNFFPSNVFGLTQSSWRIKPGKRELIRAVVWMREGLTDEQFEYVVLHEQGHALLSVEHSKIAGSILFPIVPLQPAHVELTEADAETIRDNYRRLSTITK